MFLLNTNHRPSIQPSVFSSRSICDGLGRFSFKVPFQKFNPHLHPCITHCTRLWVKQKLNAVFQRFSSSRPLVAGYWKHLRRSVKATRSFFRLPKSHEGGCERKRRESLRGRLRSNSRLVVFDWCRSTQTHTSDGKLFVSDIRLVWIVWTDMSFTRRLVTTKFCLNDRENKKYKYKNENYIWKKTGLFATRRDYYDCILILHNRD